MAEFKGLSLLGKVIFMAASSVTLGTFLTCGLWAGSYFATAKEVTTIEKRITADLVRIEKIHVQDNESLRTLIKTESASIKTEHAEDELFRLDQKQATGPLTPVEAAMHERYARRLK